MNDSKNLNSCVIELHYCLKDNSHSMDAFIFNECEREFLAIVRNVARRLGVNIEVRTEALGKGGICCWLTFISAEDIITILEICQIFIIFFNTPIGKAIHEETLGRIKNGLKGISERVLEKLKGKNVETNCDTAKSESEPYKRVIDTEKLYQSIDEDIEKNRSDFCANLILCDEVEGLTIRVIDEKGNECFQKEEITTDDMKGFILPNNKVVPEYVNDAEIKIIPPIDIEGRHKWFGEYKDEPIRFDMRSNDFKKALQSGQIRIEDIVSIRCNLEIRRKIDKEYGYVVPKGYRVMDVIDY